MALGQGLDLNDYSTARAAAALAGQILGSQLKAVRAHFNTR